MSLIQPPSNIELSNDNYVIVSIDIDDQDEMSRISTTIILEQIRSKTATCLSQALNLPINQDNIDPTLPHFKRTTPSRRVILLLFFPQQYANITNEDFIELTRQGRGLTNCIGHCYLSYDPAKNVCGIWDVCLHDQYILDVGKGHGSRMIESCLDYLLFTYQIDLTIWLGIDMRNIHFAKVAGLYVKFGFAKPYIATLDPFGYDWSGQLQSGFLAMTRPNIYIDPADVNRNSVLAEIYYSLSQYAKLILVEHNAAVPNIGLVSKIVDRERNMGNNATCSLTFRFPPKTVKFLYRLPRSVFTININQGNNNNNNNNGTINTPTITQKEFGGALKLENLTLENENEFVWQAVFDSSKQPVYVSEQYTMAPMDTFFQFHTHPRGTYGMFNVTMGYPSGTDLLNIIMASNTIIFHCVVTLEGIYVLSLSHAWFGNKLDPVRSAIQSMSEQERNTLIDKLELLNGFLSSMKEPKHPDSIQSARIYAEALNRTLIFPNQPSPFIYCTFLSWQEALQGAKVHTSFPPTGKVNCFVNKESLDNFIRMTKT